MAFTSLQTSTSVRCDLSFLKGAVDTAYASLPNAEPSNDSVRRFNIRCPERCTAVKEILLTALDATLANVLNCVSSVLVYQIAPPEKTFLRAAYQLVDHFPMLAGRYCTDRKHLSIELNNAGMPVTIAHWQRGSLDAFPAICTPTWWTELPAKAPVPCFIDDMDSFGTVFGGEPLFKLRLTTLGDGGGLLSLTTHQCLMGGACVGYLQHYLARACKLKSEVSEPLAAGLQRDLLQREGLAELLPEYADILQLGAVAADSATDIGPEESFKRRWDRLFGHSLAKMPAPFKPTKAQLYFFGCIDIPQQDLTALQELLAQLTQQRLSKNDILTGFVWVLRCVLAGDPLPGQAGSERDYGMTRIDLGVNTLKVSLADYFGNTAAACKIELPAPASQSCSIVDYSEQALVKAVGLVAAANRRTLQEWRRGGENFKVLLRRIAAPDSLAAERAALDELGAAGRQLRSQVTNLAVFGGGREASLASLDCGQGPPKQFFMLCNLAREGWAGIVPSGSGDGIFIQTMLPATAGQSINDARLFESLVPHARLRGFKAGGKQQGVSRL